MNNNIRPLGKIRLLIACNFEVLVETGIVKRDQILGLKKISDEDNFDTLSTEVLTELLFMPIVEKVDNGKYQLLQHPATFNQLLSDFRQTKIRCYIIDENIPEILMRAIRSYIFYINSGLSPVPPIEAIAHTYDNKELRQFIARHLLNKKYVAVADWKHVFPLNYPSTATINRLLVSMGLVKQRTKKPIDTVTSDDAYKLSCQVKQLTMA